LASRPQNERIDWDRYISEDDLQPFLSDLRPTEAGNAFHSYMENQVEMPGTQWEGDVYNKDGELIGRYDCHDHLGGAVYEFKTKSPRGMQKAPLVEDVHQLETYLEGLDEDIGFLVYVDRETLDVEHYPVLG
jgi:hypothetical protein